MKENPRLKVIFRETPTGEVASTPNNRTQPFINLSAFSTTRNAPPSSPIKLSPLPAPFIRDTRVSREPSIVRFSSTFLRLLQSRRHLQQSRREQSFLRARENGSIKEAVAATPSKMLAALPFFSSSPSAWQHDSSRRRLFAPASFTSSMPPPPIPTTCSNIAISSAHDDGDRKDVQGIAASSSPSFIFSAGPQQQQQQQHASSTPAAQMKRDYKPNPLLRREKDGGRQRRRESFLKRVKEGGDERRWQARGGEDELMRTIYLSEQRQWREAQERIAQGVESGMLDERLRDEEEWAETTQNEMNATDSSQQVEALLLQEQQELEELAASMDAHQMQSGEPMSESNYGSDDDEYDSLFLDVVSREGAVEKSQPSHSVWQGESMDMSG
ncbi:MAG: hypothetical protein M4579_005946 [Chaenotheca gracillima]|nr:MAG: hypothetical protein M4579_005946 [Chaenotheca gracillima]